MRIIGIIPVYNEADIIGYVIEYLLSQGVELAILDNGSTDNSYEICSRYLNKGVLWLETLSTEQYRFDMLIEKLYNIAVSLHADWVLLNAADEFLEAPYRGVTLKEAIEMEARNGFNLIQFNDFEFFPTEKDLENVEPDVRKRLKHYTWNDDLQFRCWKVCPGVKVTGTAGHYPVFPKNVKHKVVKTKYVLRHYRIRSYEHGLRKVFTDRLPRYLPEEKNVGRHIHYDNFKRDRSCFIIHSDNLMEYKDDHRWVTKKTFDWTWGVQGKAWAHPPKSRLLVRLANRFPLAARMWKAMFLRKKHLDKASN
jgi:glycosyltransferase involved in cell wall biosynthesis